MLFITNERTVITLEVLEVIRYLNSLDGPHISLQALAPYVGVAPCTLSLYLSGMRKPKPETVEMIKKGLRELIEEMKREVDRVCC